MATILFGAIGTLVGGPFGGAIGALAGRRLDGALFGAPARSGPRLQELKLSTSSYGQPIALHAGRMRSAGTVIWASDLKEHGSTGGGGKGQPKTTSYSYSVSLAVALAPHPIDAVGRIWADGNLLRGAAGDLKTGGSLRLHHGHQDQARDPLLAAVLGEACPAYRGCAYAVFEDLELSDFGNRIPALTFEIFAGEGARVFDRLVEGLPVRCAPRLAGEGVEGFAMEGGSIAETIALLGIARPPVARTEAGALAIAAIDPSAPTTLGEAIAWDEGDFGARDGARHSRAQSAAPPQALRYYDVDRDYQPSTQHAVRTGPGGEGGSIDFPVAMRADAARGLMRAITARRGAGALRFSYRMAEIDAASGPGAIVRVPGEAGLWQVQSWEWRDGGVEVELESHWPGLPPLAGADPGSAAVPRDRLAAPTTLRAFELPWDGTGSPDDRIVYAAVSAGEGRWSGGALFAEQDEPAGGLVPLGVSVDRSALGGTTTTALAGSDALMIERDASLVIAFGSVDTLLASITDAGLALGENRLLVESEVMQFRTAEPLGDGAWRLTGLLRGRGGTEAEAAHGHAAGARATLLDARVAALAPAPAVLSARGLAAVDTTAAEPAYAAIEQRGRGHVPPFPVHGRVDWLADGSLALRWTRRARGAWHWADAVDTPLVEQSERYEIGLGPVAAPILAFESDRPEAAIAAAQLGAVPSGTPVWVRQIGTHARSHPLHLTRT